MSNSAIIEMTVSEARKILTRPVFGDQRCIEARDLLKLAAEVSKARKRFPGQPWEEPPARISKMYKTQLSEELDEYFELGWQEES